MQQHLCKLLSSPLQYKHKIKEVHFPFHETFALLANGLEDAGHQMMMLMN
jgi:hypothetical protein